ncbi:MAG: DUF2029 domain-containing protein, partial [Dehalococcoidia bacterium]|nr:DUF2029 domain-containing protein [Dehalococcoidia bacterium]
MNGLMTRARWVLAQPLIALAALVAAQGGFGLWVAIGQRSVDFPVYLFAATLAARGESMYVVPPGRWAELARELGVATFTDPYLYPPLTAGVAGLFRGLPYPGPLIVWNLLSVAAVVGTGSLLARACRRRWLDAATWWILAAYFPIYTTLFAGQVNTFVALAVAIFVWATAVGRRGIAGVGLAFSVMLKPLSIALVALPLWRRDWRASIATAVGFGLATLAGVILT